MRVLVLWADQRSDNLGVRVLAEGAAAMAGQAWPNCQVRHLNYGVHEEAPRISWRALAPELLHRGPLQNWISTFDIVLDTRAGDSFTDIYGASRFLQMSILGRFASRNVPTVLLPQTIGPFTSRWSQLVARRSTGNYRAVMTRDSESLEIARMHLTPVAVSSSDLVFALPVQKPTETFDTILNVSGLLWAPNSHVDSEHYRGVVRSVIRAEFDRGRAVTLLPHVLRNASLDNDERTIDQLTNEFSDLSVRVPSNLDSARQLIAGASLVVGARMHACLNALSQGIPALPLAYSRKFAPLLADLGWSHGLDLRERIAPGTVDLALQGALADISTAARARMRGANALTSSFTELRRALNGAA